MLTGGVERITIARAFAGVIADAAVHRRQRIVAHQRFPGGAVFARLRQREPSLDVLASGASVVAGRQQVDIDRAPGAEGTGPFSRVRSTGGVKSLSLCRIQ